MRQHDKVLRDHIAMVMKAADFAARRHSGQVRKGAAREPYLNHLAEVAALLAETMEEPDAWLVAAGWLHDTIEDTATEREELAEQFGEKIAALVSEVTDDKSLPKAARKRLQIETAAQKSPRARALKIADKISNIRSLIVSPPDHWERERLIDYVDWSEKVVAGCRGVNSRLDQLFDQTVAEARKAL
jgi:guanosine-3',5'-bis(diphosphate) 3'-pyrophosphohydrolase